MYLSSVLHVFNYIYNMYLMYDIDNLLYSNNIMQYMYSIHPIHHIHSIHTKKYHSNHNRHTTQTGAKHLLRQHVGIVVPAKSGAR